MRDYKSQTSRSSVQAEWRNADRARPPRWLWLAGGLGVLSLATFLLYPSKEGNEATPAVVLATPATLASQALPIPAATPAPKTSLRERLAMVEHALPMPKFHAAKPAPVKAVEKPAPQEEADAAADERVLKEAAAPKFQFYELLPNMHVEVPAETAKGATPTPLAALDPIANAEDKSLSLAEGAAPQSTAPATSAAPADSTPAAHAVAVNKPELSKSPNPPHGNGAKIHKEP